MRTRKNDPVASDAAGVRDQASRGGQAANSGAENGAALDPQQRIRIAAYLRYLSRGGAPGGALDDWLQAEAELASRPDAKG